MDKYLVSAVKAITSASISLGKLRIKCSRVLEAKEYSDLSNQLKTVARLISGGLESKVYLVKLNGFDTHFGQVQTQNDIIGDHNDLLTELDQAVSKFMLDISSQGVQDDIVGLTFSEFGRKAKENGLDLDINLTKAKLLDAWDIHFNESSSPSAVDDAATAMAESAASQKESTDEDVVAEDARAEEETPVEEEAPVEAKISLDEKSSSQIINDFESSQMKTDLPNFRPGDTVTVSVKVKEGDRGVVEFRFGEVGFGGIFL